MCPIATLPITDLACTDLGANPGLHGEKPGHNRLISGAAWIKLNSTWLFNDDNYALYGNMLTEEGL
jgi:hypothetical protein